MHHHPLEEIDRVWKGHFHDPWPDHLDQLNRLVEHKGVRFWLPNRKCSPAWINGDPALMEPGKWVLVVSLNPHIDPDNNKLQVRTDYSPKEWQAVWKIFNATREHWKGSFFPHLGRLASTCLALELDREQEKTFVHEQMLFIEFCPYASPNLRGIKWEEWKSLAEGEPAFEVSRHVRRILFDFGEPALVLCNGTLAARDVRDQQFGVHKMKIGTLDVEGKVALPFYSGIYAPKEG